MNNIYKSISIIASNVIRLTYKNRFINLMKAATANYIHVQLTIQKAFLCNH
jgi:hypothetical protein